MTGDELQRAIEFLLESHANLTVKLDRTAENTDRLEEAIDRLEGIVERLAEGYGHLAEGYGHLAEGNGRLAEGQERAQQQAAADRAEVRAAVNTMLSFAEAMAENVTLLTRAQQGTTERLGRVESRVDRLEGPEG